MKRKEKKKKKKSWPLLPLSLFSPGQTLGKKLRLGLEENDKNRLLEKSGAVGGGGGVA